MLAMNVQYLRPPFTEGGVLVPRPSVRQPGYLPYTRRRPLGFARPPHDGFAFSRRTRGCAYLQAHSPETLAMSAHHTVNRSPTQYLLESFPPPIDDASMLLCVTRDLMHALCLSPRGDEFPMNFVPFRALFLANFAEYPKGEVRRIPIPRNPLNKGKTKGRG
jgi:hypothetical protein